MDYPIVEPSPFIVEASDRLAIAVLRLIDNEILGQRSGASDALLVYVTLRFDVVDGLSGIAKLRKLSEEVGL